MKKNLLKINVIAILLLMVTMGCSKEKNVTHVTLDKPEITIFIGETATLTATVYPEGANNKTVSWTSSNMDIAMVANGIITAKKEGETTITVITEDGNFTTTCLVTVISKWVEINGVKWAKSNVDLPGTFAKNPEDIGMYYQWNRKKGWAATGEITGWDNTEAEGSAWEATNDPCPAGWRVPTVSEFRSLANANNQWTTINDQNGRIFGSGDNTIFLPAAGVRESNNGEVVSVNMIGIYWSGNVLSQYTEPYVLTFMDTEVGIFLLDSRAHGVNVRCVTE